MEELVKKAKKGNNEAFSTLITSIQNDLYKIARMKLASQDDINDAIQETIIHAYQSISSLKKPKYFKTWIIRILINECNKIYRLNAQSGDELEADFYVSNTSSDLDNKMNELDFDMLIQNLTYEERLIITLFYLENLKSKEIASILKMNENTIKVKLLRARKKLKKSIEGGIYE